MPETVITRNQIVVVNEVGTNDYGDLTFTDKDGGQYKVAVKRKSYFEKTIIPGTAVQLNYAVAYGKEYIYSAVSVAGKLPPPDKPKVVVSPPVENPRKTESPQVIYKSSPETGMWWKEVGENFRAGLFKKDDDRNGALLWRAYIAQMLSSLEITIEKSKGKEG